MDTKIMYCPRCRHKSEIKVDPDLEGLICPLCNEGTLTTAEVKMSDYLRMFYRNNDFHLQERKC